MRITSFVIVTCVSCKKKKKEQSKDLYNSRRCSNSKVTFRCKCWLSCPNRWQAQALRQCLQHQLLKLQIKIKKGKKARNLVVVGVGVEGEVLKCWMLIRISWLLNHSKFVILKQLKNKIKAILRKDVHWKMLLWSPRNFKV